MKIRLAAILFLAAALASAQQLKRHGMIGLAVAPDDQHRAAVTAVVPGGAGAGAGIEKGDILQSLDGAPVTSSGEFARAIGRHFGGDRVEIAILRSGLAITKTATLKPRPFETSKWADVLYDAVPVDGSLRRTIVTHPHKEGRLPAVLLIGGLGCYSLDGEDRASGYGRVIDELEQRGYVTMRVDKTGEGDSQGPDCEDSRDTPALEAGGYIAGLAALKKYDFVDAAHIFVFAHSMGPLIGSLAVAKEQVNGFIAVETVGTSWYEYDLERSRIQYALDGGAPDEVDAEVRNYIPCSYRYYIGKETSEQLDKTSPCHDFSKPFGGMPDTYMQAVADISLGRQWKQADIPVLVIYGTGSPVTTAHQSHYLADLINELHPGRATYVEIPGMGHNLNIYASQAEYMHHAAEPHPFATGLIDVMTAWLDKQRQG